MWLVYTIASAVFLGCYEVFKKLSLRGNAMIPVLFLTPVFCSLIFSPALILSYLCPERLEGSIFLVGKLTGTDHLYILLKSCIVLISWALAYLAMQNLPITIASPIKSTQPMFVLIGAFLAFGERMNVWQWGGALLALICLFLYSRIGEKEGISFVHNKWIWCLFAAVLTGAVSGLYDKYMMRQFDRMAVQVWYTIYQSVLMLPVLLIHLIHKKRSTKPMAEYQWRWAIVFLALFLCISDFLYFYALSIPDSMISVVSPIRRSGVIVSFVIGAIFFKEKNIKQKAVVLLGVLVGILFLYFGSK